MEKKKCLQCENPFVGRPDKKFCSNSCRSKFFYSMEAEFNEHKSRVHVILRKNREILALLNPTGNCIVEKQVLIEKDFNFNFFTTTYHTKGGSVYWFCYDYGFRKLIKNKAYQLVKWLPYMAQCTMMSPSKSENI